MIYRPSAIVSGGQTGADQGGLLAAEALDISTGGWAPRDWITETGPDPQLGSRFGLIQHATRYDYPPRTEDNVKLADATVIFGRRSRGSNLTERLCKEHKRPFIWIMLPQMRSEILRFRLWLARERPETLNVAGNRESTTPGIQAAVERFLMQTFA